MIAIIPARGGSKGVPGKNIKELGGKPLIAYTIEAALKSKHITRVILSTDNLEIAKVGRLYGAEVPFMRPSHLASDTAKAIDAYKYTYERLEKEENIEISEFVILQPTSPFRTANHIDQAIDLYKNKKADSVIGYCPEHHPIIWHKYIAESGKIESILEGTIRNRQEEKPSYFPNGAIYIFKREIIEQGIYHTDNTYAFIMNRKDSVDIDTIEDFEYANFLIAKNKS
ncbi:cytidylyltransferase domain-containing protein [Gillisia sp. JM1]|uniref:acylneuraminate cytidylyltransferase family protein n=1 Tax=Gillisia sp. JM1 TaxID=1283286 RepID=UPI000402FBC4|nr:acylneuraminate cytidylyltransferase family protein [Gillisia sp. JM1]